MLIADGIGYGEMIVAPFASKQALSGVIKGLKHLSSSSLGAFKNGASKLMSSAQLDDLAKRFPDSQTFGSPTGTFVAPSGEIDELLKAGLSREEIAQSLGITDELFLDGDLVRIDISPGGFDNLRTPTGSEVGANSKFIPGGKTSGGVTEGVLDNIKKDSEFVTTSTIEY